MKKLKLKQEHKDQIDKLIETSIENALNAEITYNMTVDALEKIKADKTMTDKELAEEKIKAGQYKHRAESLRKYAEQLEAVKKAI